MNKLLVFLTCLFSFILAYPSSSQETPPWVKGNYPPKNGTFHYMVADGSGATLKEAQHDADLSLITDLMRASGVTVSGKQIEKILVNIKDGQPEEKNEFSSQYDFTYDNVKMSFKAVDRYVKQKGKVIECKTLYEVANDPSKVSYLPVEYTNSYGARGLWRSALIPGWGQMYKQSYFKGALFLAAEIGCVATALAFENQRSSYVNKARAAYSADAISFYQKKANNARNIRNGLIIGASGVYIVNLVDALVAKGKLRYKKSKGKELAINPYFDGAVNVSLAYTF